MPVVTSSIDTASLVSAMGDAVIVTDAAGLICLWNPAAERIFGYSQQEAIGHSLDLITPERHRKRHWEGYHRTMVTGITKYGTDVLRVPATAKDGRPLSIAFTVALLSGADGKPEAIAAVIRDETERFQEERALRKRVGELEALVTPPLVRAGA
jgi:PAS domain S-box-containing protein